MRLNETQYDFRVCVCVMRLIRAVGCAVRTRGENDFLKIRIVTSHNAHVGASI